MSKLDLQNIDFCPPRKWLAIYDADKQGGGMSGEATGVYATHFTFPEILDFGKVHFDDLDEDIHLLSCHLCGFTGYTDSKGEDMYGGQLAKITGIAIANMAIEFYVVIALEENKWTGLPLDSDYPTVNLVNTEKHFTIIGHIHQPDQWPEEVRRLLE